MSWIKRLMEKSCKELEKDGFDRVSCMSHVDLEASYLLYSLRLKWMQTYLQINLKLNQAVREIGGTEYAVEEIVNMAKKKKELLKREQYKFN